MYLPIAKTKLRGKKNKSNRYGAKLKAKNRRRVNRMHKRKLGRRLPK